ncbi:tail tube protein [Arthrobacter phage BarretLemon]|uniref:Tail tube protein n=1 Tax=Arthrobacter phage BarretLemon TaxID=1796994 RepID=A0A140G743_9CAUD|nr:tail tube protein [Arthrobacter phage BarretLemon]AMM44478.1 tail tube protein [Arthrobacter phage BarretLemon]
MAGNRTQKATKRQFIVSIAGIPGNWRTMSGASASSETTEDWDGGAERPDILGGPVSFDDIEVVRTIAPALDMDWVRRLRRRVGIDTFTVTKQAVDRDGVKVGRPDVYPDCLLKGMQEPETDAASSDLAEITLTFATSGPA